MITGRTSDRGQVLIIFVFAAVALMAITGLAIDGADVFSDRRHAQNAADTAALAGALKMVEQEKGNAAGCTDLITPTPCGALVANAALDVASDNGYSSNVTDNTVEVHVPPVDGPYSNCSNQAFTCTDYLEVIISTNVNTFFARVLGIGQLHNRVEAVALAKYRPTQSLYGGATLASLDPTNCNSFDITGSAQLALNGGANIFVNSNSLSCPAFVLQHCDELSMNQPSPVGVVGSSSVPTCTPPLQTTTTTPARAVQFPPDPLFATPSVCSAPVNASGGTYNPLDKTYHFPPGHYSSLTLPQSKDSTFDSGVFCVDSIIKGTGNNSSHYGNGVFFWIKAGGYFEWEGGTTNLSAPTSGQYAGYLMYVDWTSTEIPGSTTCILNGNGSSSYIGTIFAPYCDIQLNGVSGAGGWHTQIVGYDFLINGTTNLDFEYNGTPSTNAPEINWTGLLH